MIVLLFFIQNTVNCWQTNDKTNKISKQILHCKKLNLVFWVRLHLSYCSTSSPPVELQNTELKLKSCLFEVTANNKIINNRNINKMTAEKKTF